MKSNLLVTLNADALQKQRLHALQCLFAKACNEVARVVQETRCWHRVTLHHWVYRMLRQRFPELGSQMICNAIYSVSRTARLVFQHPQSPWHLSRLGEKPLPLLRFTDSAPVYFDRHTLNVRQSGLSMYSLDGRLHFDLQLAPLQLRSFREQRLKEIVLFREGEEYRLSFSFGGGEDAFSEQVAGEAPEYVLVIEMEHERALHHAVSSIAKEAA